MVVPTNGRLSVGVEAVAAVVGRRSGGCKMWITGQQVARGGGGRRESEGDAGSGGIKLVEWAEAHCHQACQRSELRRSELT